MGESEEAEVTSGGPLLSLLRCRLWGKHVTQGQSCLAVDTASFQTLQVDSG